MMWSSEFEVAVVQSVVAFTAFAMGAVVGTLLPIPAPDWRTWFWKSLAIVAMVVVVCVDWTRPMAWSRAPQELGFLQVMREAFVGFESRLVVFGAGAVCGLSLMVVRACTARTARSGKSSLATIVLFAPACAAGAVGCQSTYHVYPRAGVRVVEPSFGSIDGDENGGRLKAHDVAPVDKPHGLRRRADVGVDFSKSLQAAKTPSAEEPEALPVRPGGMTGNAGREHRRQGGTSATADEGMVDASEDRGRVAAEDTIRGSKQVAEAGNDNAALVPLVNRSVARSAHGLAAGMNPASGQSRVAGPIATYNESAPRQVACQPFVNDAREAAASGTTAGAEREGEAGPAPTPAARGSSDMTDAVRDPSDPSREITVSSVPLPAHGHRESQSEPNRSGRGSAGSRADGVCVPQAEPGGGGSQGTTERSAADTERSAVPRDFGHDGEVDAGQPVSAPPLDGPVLDNDAHHRLHERLANRIRETGAANGFASGAKSAADGDNAPAQCVRDECDASTDQSSPNEVGHPLGLPALKETSGSGVDAEEPDNVFALRTNATDGAAIDRSGNETPNGIELTSSARTDVRAALPISGHEAGRTAETIRSEASPNGPSASAADPNSLARVDGSTEHDDESRGLNAIDEDVGSHRRVVFASVCAIALLGFFALRSVSSRAIIDFEIHKRIYRRPLRRDRLIRFPTDADAEEIASRRDVPRQVGATAGLWFDGRKLGVDSGQRGDVQIEKRQVRRSRRLKIPATITFGGNSVRVLKFERCSANKYVQFLQGERRRLGTTSCARG